MQEKRTSVTKTLPLHPKRRLWRKLVAGMACIVVFVTTYLLILPALTLEQTAYCGLEEHKHSAECYETKQICGKTEDSAHTHTDACYREEPVLTCGKEESAGHVHGESCFRQDRTLVCSEEHTHTDACYETTETRICGEEESPGHTHTDACCETRRTRICEDPADTPHVHGESCCENVLVCKKPEHEHTLACYSNPDADVESEAVWQRSIADVSLTGNWADDAAAIAKSQLGYTESTQNYLVDEEGAVKGYSRYGAWYGSPYGDWCAMFVSFCLHYAEIPSDAVPYEASCPRWVETLSEKEWNLYREKDGYQPQKGDLIFFDYNADNSADHVGLVTKRTPAAEDAPAEIEVIEGNSSDCVRTVTYDPADKTILGYAVLPENPEPTKDEQARISEIIAMIDALPTSEEAEAMFARYEEAEDTENAERLAEDLADAVQNGRTAYAAYEDLRPVCQALVTNREKLLSLLWLWSAVTLDSTDSVTVHQINQYTQAATTLVWGGSVREKLGGMSYYYWDAMIIEKDASGKYYVARYETADGDKRDYRAANGFVLLLYNTSVAASVGDSVSVDFNYQTTGGYNGGGYGRVTFGSATAPKPDKDNSAKLSTIQGADTRGLIEVNLYDYNSSVNSRYLSDHKYPGFQQEGGSKNVGGSFSKWQSFNFGNNITSDLAAGISGVTNQGGAINATANGANSPISGAMLQTLGGDGYPALADGTSLRYLFSNSPEAAKQNSQSINGLFLYHEDTGAYTFNSRENHAQFNAGSDTFTLYNQILTSNFMMYPFGNFLPFNDIVHQSAQTSTIDRAYLDTIANSAQYKDTNGAGDAYGTLSAQLSRFLGLMDQAYPNGWTGADCMNEYFKAASLPPRFSVGDSLVQNLYSIDYDEPTDFYFGMEMKMNFLQPKNGLTGKDGRQPMVFYFTGDDDVWVYLDGVLFLDLSGIHRHVGGEIDFVNGVVQYYDLDVSTGDVSATPSKTVPFSSLVSSGLNSKGTFTDYSSHTFNFYYMERGSGSGVCRMNFNFPLLRKNSISVSKELTTDEGGRAELLGNPDFRFQVLRETGTDLFIGGNTPYDILDEAGSKTGEGVTDENGVFALKGGETALFQNIEENAGKYFVRELLDPDAFGQYGKISVDGSSETTSYDVTVGADTFKGVNSPLKDMSDGSTRFYFDNEISYSKLGSLSITKHLETYPQTRAAAQFSFSVTLDGAPLPAGTTYLAGGETRTVTEPGVIVLAPEETAVIPKILAGSVFTVKETEASAQGYAVTYRVDGETSAGDGVSGVIRTNTAVEVAVVNGEKGASVSIPVSKTLENPDGKVHAYTFLLTQVTDRAGKTDAEPALSKTLTIPVRETAGGAFTIDYPQSALQTLPAAYYYRITEQADPADRGTLFDTAQYVAEVTVREEADGTLSAAVTGLFRDGKPADEAAFTNQIAHFELPKTGGAGTKPYTIAGILLTLSAGGILLYHQIRRRMEESASS